MAVWEPQTQRVWRGKKRRVCCADDAGWMQLTAVYCSWFSLNPQYLKCYILIILKSYYCNTYTHTMYTCSWPSYIVVYCCSIWGVVKHEQLVACICWLYGDLPLWWKPRLGDSTRSGAWGVADSWWWPLGIHSIDWFNGKITRKPHISWENLWFPVDFPLSQPIDKLSRHW